YYDLVGVAHTRNISEKPEPLVGAPALGANVTAAELPANPCRTGGGAPTRNISEKPEPTVGAPASGANASRRRLSCRQTRFAPRAVLLRRTYRRSPNPP